MNELYNYCTISFNYDLTKCIVKIVRTITMSNKVRKMLCYFIEVEGKNLEFIIFGALNLER